MQKFETPLGFLFKTKGFRICVISAEVGVFFGYKFRVSKEAAVIFNLVVVPTVAYTETICSRYVVNISAGETHAKPEESNPLNTIHTSAITRELQVFGKRYGMKLFPKIT